jgi:hypothetical protein
MQSKAHVRLQEPVSDKQSNSLSYAHFTGHLAGVIEKLPRKHRKNKNNSSLGTDGSKTRPTSTYKHSHSNRTSTKLLLSYKQFVKHMVNTSQAAEKHTKTEHEQI